MSTPGCLHATISNSREFRSPPAAVFGAWADPETHRHWQPAPEGTEYVYDRHDFRAGGIEHCELRRGGEVLARFVNRYLEIAEGRRIIFSVRAEAPDGTIVSVAQHTIEILPHGEGARLRCTEQVVWPSGESREQEHQGGWKMLLDRLVAFLDG